MSLFMGRLLEYGHENDPLETLKRFAVALDFHPQDGALPGREQKFGEVMRSEGRGDLAGRLPVSDACGERRAPFGEDLGETRPQHLALRRGLETEIADQAAVAELGIGEGIGDDDTIAPK